MEAKYIFFYLKTGGGHLAPARSVAQYLEASDGEKTKVILADGLKEANPFIKGIIEDGYRKSITKAVCFLNCFMPSINSNLLHV